MCVARLRACNDVLCCRRMNADRIGSANGMGPNNVKVGAQCLTLLDCDLQYSTSYSTVGTNK